MSEELVSLSQVQVGTVDAERILEETRMKEESAKRERHENAQKEYTEVALFIRHYSGLRFAVLTLFFAVSGVLGGAVFGSTLTYRHQAFLLALKSLGLLFTIVFGAFAWQLDIFVRNLNMRGHELRRDLGYSHGLRPMPAFLRLLDTRLVYLALAIVWLGEIVIDPLVGQLWRAAFHTILRH